MENVNAVEPIDAAKDRFRWMIAGPAGTDLRVETEVVSDKPGEEIAWRALDSSQIDTEGKVSFRDAPGDRGTEVEAIIAYDPPAGEFGALDRQAVSGRTRASGAAGFEAVQNAYGDRRNRHLRQSQIGQVRRETCAH